MSLVFVILVQAIRIYSYALIIYILMSWFPGARESSIGQILGKICEPYLEVFRKFIPPLGMFDFSPIVGILALQFATYGVYQVYAWIM
ncbi:YggT family protein [Bacillus sp. AGMB 02131]|uniref:YggT family protein n=1 Tax=Peribacillus faecalis TaxID=2772559 RepID=A0A927H9W0_9BACI|nr:YggT family protein [Peribacillus faecalis]MBD3106806.1 YggT family protein [Peribacillus faecalis]